MILARNTDDPIKNHVSGVQGTHADRCEPESQQEIKKKKKIEPVSMKNSCNEFCWKKNKNMVAVLGVGS